MIKRDLMSVANMIVCTMMDPIHNKARKLAQTVIRPHWLIDLEDVLNNAAESFNVIMGTGLIFSGVDQQHCDLYVADSLETLQSLNHEVAVFCREANLSNINELTLKHQRNIGRLFGYSEEALTNEAIIYTTPNATLLESDTFATQVLSFNKEMFKKLIEFISTFAGKYKYD